MIKLSHVDIPYETADFVKRLILTQNVGQSEIIEQFEQEFAQWIGAKYCVAVASGTLADSIALGVLKHMNPGRTEVIVPALTFIAQVNAIYYNQLKPVFVDVGPDLLMWPAYAADKVNSKTLCVFPTHLLGKPCDMLGYDQMGKSLKVPVVEDACEALGSEFNPGYTGWKKCGTFGEMGTFSFFPSHTITTGEGGMIATDSEDCANLARRLRNHGKTNTQDFYFDCIGFNGKMNSLEAAVGYMSVRDLNRVINRRRDTYFNFGGKEDERTEKICPHAFPIILGSQEARDKKLAELREAGIECRNLFGSIPTQQEAYRFLGHRLGDFPVAEMIGGCALYVPCHQGMQAQDIDKIRNLIDNK